MPLTTQRRPRATVPAADPPPPGPRRAPARGLRRLATAAPFIVPSLAGVLLFLLIPVVIVLVLSFIQWNFLTPPRWVGLANFSTMVRDDHVFHALLISAYYVLWNIPLQTAAALALAMLLVRKMPAMGLFRALYVLPYMSTPVAMAVVWSWMFNAQNGLVNHLLSLAGLHGPDWLGNTSTALPVIAMVNIWQYAGYNMLFFLAGLLAIPPQLYESASIDGASAFRRFTRITLPLLNSTATSNTTSDQVYLHAGINPVQYVNSGAATVAIDALQVTPDNAAAADAATYAAAAAQNVLSGAAVVQANQYAYGGSGVGYIGNGAANTLTFTGVKAVKAGTYRVMLSYADDDAAGTGNYNTNLIDRGFTVSTSAGTSEMLYARNTYSWDQFDTIEVTVQLAAGSNTVTIGNPAGYAWNIDKIIVAPAYLP